MRAVAVESQVSCDPGFRVRCVHFCYQSDSHNGKLKEQFDRYLIIRKSEKQESGYTVNVREDVLAEEPAHAGWLVLVSNHIIDAAEAIRIYRDKDVVEKGFHRIGEGSHS